VYLLDYSRDNRSPSPIDNSPTSNHIGLHSNIITMNIALTLHMELMLLNICEIQNNYSD